MSFFVNNFFLELYMNNIVKIQLVSIKKSNQKYKQIFNNIMNIKYKQVIFQNYLVLNFLYLRRISA